VFLAQFLLLIYILLSIASQVAVTTKQSIYIIMKVCSACLIWVQVIIPTAAIPTAAIPTTTIPTAAIPTPG
jgi:hypothetical protein